MPVFDWHFRQTKYFGIRWFPIARVHLQDCNGVYQPIALQIDSGAVISLIPRSLADYLGLPLYSGQRVEMTSVGGGTTIAYVHSIATKFEDTPLVIRFAIADSENVPSLLGRLDVFDHFRIAFDPALKQTAIAAISSCGFGKHR